MVLLVEPLERALAAIRAARADGDAGATGALHADAASAVRHGDRRASSRAGAGAILLCARYEGVDQRFIDAHVDLEI